MGNTNQINIRREFLADSFSFLLSFSPIISFILKMSSSNLSGRSNTSLRGKDSAIWRKAVRVTNQLTDHAPNQTSWQASCQAPEQAIGVTSNRAVDNPTKQATSRSTESVTRNSIQVDNGNNNSNQKGNQKTNGAEQKPTTAEPKATGANQRQTGANLGATGVSPKATGADPRKTGADPRPIGANLGAAGASPKATGVSQKAAGADSRATGAVPMVINADQGATVQNSRATTNGSMATKADPQSVNTNRNATDSEVELANIQLAEDLGIDPAVLQPEPEEEGSAADIFSSGLLLLAGAAMGIFAYHVGSRAAEPVMSLLRDKLHPSNENYISNGPAGPITHKGKMPAVASRKMCQVACPCGCSKYPSANSVRF